MRDQLDALDARIGECDRQITAQQANDPLAKRARDLPGVGLITADAVTASVGYASMFRDGRQFADWLGLTPSQSGSGGKTKLGRITRRVDDYLRTSVAWIATPVEPVLDEWAVGRRADWAAPAPRQSPRSRARAG